MNFPSALGLREDHSESGDCRRHAFQIRAVVAGRQASPGPEKLEAGGVVRAVGNGRSVAPDREAGLPFAS